MNGARLGTREGGLTSIVGILALLAGCAPAGSSHTMATAPAPDPSQWTEIRCQSCASANVTIETRRSIAPQGHPGQYTYARIRNLNPHGVVFVTDFTLAERSYPDQDIVIEQQRLTLEAAGTPAATTVVMLHGRGRIAEAAVYGVEKF